MHKKAFTFVEIIATLLLLTLGLGSVIGLMNYGQELGNQSVEDNTALFTAITLINDPEPYGFPYTDSNLKREDAEWKRNQKYDADGETYDAQGFLNGYYVTRKTGTENPESLGMIDISSKKRYASIVSKTDLQFVEVKVIQTDGRIIAYKKQYIVQQ